ncbi:hypothetical protein T492DRAFT_832863 [Pavlovales sp. CCMP2436]|nr:hypothetical protein T492DRAFT_832863 [Pavlovales sp. CCMP2436]
MFACCAKKPKEVAVVGAPFAVEALPHADTKRRASKPAKGMGSAKGMGNDLNSEKTTTLINSILTVTLKVDIIDAIEAMKREPMDVGKGYKLSVLSGMVDGPPEVIACKTAGLPDRGEATGYVFAFEDTTTSEEPLILKLETSNWWEPNIYLTVRDYKVGVLITRYICF